MESGGSSPQARGSADCPAAPHRTPRFIPAGAGIGHPGLSHEWQTTVHPRRRGDRTHHATGNVVQVGSSPQARGSVSRLSSNSINRFIPAGAGIGCSRCRKPVSDAVHPRRRGDRIGHPIWGKINTGSSPQARGSVPLRPPRLIYLRFIPAGAGIGVTPAAGACVNPVHPRRRGDRRFFCLSVRHQCGSSPQARGSERKSCFHNVLLRFIPAGAGIGGAVFVNHCRDAVHPRRRGDRLLPNTSACINSGSSPQARGSGRYVFRRNLSGRFIPAGAGIGLVVDN